MVALLTSTLLVATVKAEGEIKWVQTESVNGEARGVAVDSTGIYIVGSEHMYRYAQWRIEKRNLTDVLD